MGSTVGTTTPPAAAARSVNGASPWTRRGWLVAVAALLTLLLVDVLRVWLPSVVHVHGDAGSTPALQLGAFAAVWFLLPFPVALAARRVGPAQLFRAGVVVAVLARLTVQVTSGGGAQLWASSAALVAVATALVGLAAGTPSGHLARVGVVVGLALGTASHAALGTLDLVWRDGPVVTGAVVVLGAATLAVAVRALQVPLWWPTTTSETGDLAPVWTRGPAWPWLGIGPAVVLTGVLVAAPARLELALGWSPPTVVAALAVAGGVAVALAVLSPTLGGPVAGSLGAVVTVAATLGALRPTGAVGAVAQLALLAGIGLVLGAPGTAPGDSGPRRRGSAAAGGLLGFFVLGFAYYASYELPLPVHNRTFLVLAAAGLAALGAGAGWVGRGLHRTRRVPRGTLAAVGAATVTVAVVGAIVVPGAAATPPATGSGPDELRVAAFNVRSGYGTDGRFDPDAIAEVLRTEGVDVVVLNEVDRGWLLEGGHDLVRLLGDRLGMPHRTFAPAADEVWGNAVLSRRPLRDVRTDRLPREGVAMDRSLVSVVVDVGGASVGLVGVHLHHVRDEPQVRLVQARAVAAEVSRLTGRDLPVAVLGDLNADVDDAELEPLSFLHDALPGGGPTHPADAPERRIDHVLVTEQLDADDGVVPEVTVSDHRPVVVTLRLAADADG